MANGNALLQREFFLAPHATRGGCSLCIFMCRRVTVASFVFRSRKDRNVEIVVDVRVIQGGGKGDQARQVHSQGNSFLGLKDEVADIVIAWQQLRQK